MNNEPQKIVIVGGGAGGIELATLLGRTLGKTQKAKITLVDAQQTHLWKPLLHEVASGSLNAFENELSYLAQAKWNHFHFIPGKMESLNRTEKSISLSPILDDNGEQVVPARTLKYDKLVMSVGCQSNDFHTPGAQQYCLFLDNRQQAERIHTTLVNHYLHAQTCGEKAPKLRIAIIGAGATGVELAAELHYAAIELAKYGLDAISPDHMELTIIEGGERILPALPERVSNNVHKQLLDMGVRIMTGKLVSEIKADGVATRDGEFIAADIRIWAAGIKAAAFLSQLDGLETNRGNQLVVRPTLQTTQDDNIYAIGDCSSCTLTNAKNESTTIPPTAQAAHQQAYRLAKSLKAQLNGSAPPTYSYHNHGTLISLSHFSAVGNLLGSKSGKMMVEGMLAKWFYVSLYRMHQMVMFGKLRTGTLMLKDLFGRTTRPQLKLH